MEESARRMLELFAGFDGAHGTHGTTETNLEKAGKREIKRTARTLRQPVTLALWRQHLAGERALGIIPIRRDATCVWGAIDVDVYPVDHAMIAQELARRQLPLHLCKTKSGGAHIFVFLSEPVPARDVQTILRQIAASLGYAGSEIFPKQVNQLATDGDLGSWLNMPYHGDSRFCVKKTGSEMTLEEFITTAEKSKIDRQTFIALAELQNRDEDHFSDGPPCLQHLTTVTEQRNVVLFNVAGYCKKRYGQDWKEKLDEYNRERVSPPLPSDEVAQIIKSHINKEYNYQCNTEPLCNHCNSQVCRTRRFGIGGGGAPFPAISGISVLDSEPKVFFVDIDNHHRIDLLTEELMSFKKFQEACVEKAMVVYSPMRQKDWLDMVHSAMENATVIEAAPEVGITGKFLEYLEDFLTNRYRGQVKEDILLGKPWEDEDKGVHYFQLRDLDNFLHDANFKVFTNRGKLAQKIRDIDGDKTQLNLNGYCRNVWWVPANFVKKNVTVPTPKIDRDPIT